MKLTFAQVFILVCVGLAVAMASHEALDVPDIDVLKQKFGSFESFVRSKLSDTSKVWLDQAPTVFDGSSQAWARGITCAKNLADNAALNVFGSVSEAFSRDYFAKQKQELMNGAVFSSEIASKSKNTFDPKAFKKDVISKQSTAFLNKLQTCFKTQISMVDDLFAQNKLKFARNMFSPAGTTAEDSSKPIRDEIKAGFGRLEKQAQITIQEAISSASKRAQAVPNMALTAAMLVNPSLGGSVYCGDETVCMNGGRCIAKGVCACPAEWRGASCTEPLNMCVSLGIRCAGKSVCSASEGQWQCNCAAGFAGLYCERYDSTAPATPAAPASAQGPSVQFTLPPSQNTENNYNSPEYAPETVVSRALLRKLRPFLNAQMPMRDFRVANAALVAQRQKDANALAQASLLEVENRHFVEAEVVDSHTAMTSMDNMYI